MMNFNAQLVFKKNFKEAKEIWDAISPLINSERVDIFNFEESHLSKLKVRQRITSYFQVKGEGYSIDFDYNANSQINILFVDNVRIILDEFENILKPLFQNPSFLQGRIYDEKYDIWQNMNDIGYYESSDRDHSHLLKKNNGKPYPLEATIIDTSSNPGRYIFHDGYIEFLGSTMWFGREFLNFLNSDIEKMKELSFINTECFDNYIKIIAQDKPFVENDGTEDKQRLLRSLLYLS